MNALLHCAGAFYAPTGDSVKNIWLPFIVFVVILSERMADIKNIFIVEDDRFLSSLMKARLEKEGFVVTQLFDGEEAVEQLKTSKPDLILLDLIMPKVSGFEVLEQISIDPQTNTIPIIVLTNLAQGNDVDKAKQYGAKEYFVKVRTSVNDIVERVRNLVR